MADSFEMDHALDQAPGGYCAFSDDGVLLTVNILLREWLGYGPGELEGRHLESILSGGARIFYQTYLFPLLRLHGRAEEIYLSLRSREGGELAVLANAVRRERVGRFVCEIVFLPMRRRTRYEDEILEAKKAAETAVQEKSQAYDALSIAQTELASQQQELLAVNAELRIRAEREALLNRIGETIRTAASPLQVLESAVREIGQALGADRGYYVAYDPAASLASVGPEWYRPDLTPLAGQYPISGDGIRHAPGYHLGHSQVLSDTANDADLARAGLRAVLRVPLLSGAAMTALAVAMVDGPREWTPEEVSLVETVATLTQSALEATRVQRREHTIAEQLQAALQPPLPPGVAGLKLAKFYEVALEEAGVGGDFFDVFSIEKGCTVLAVGDVSGKGLAAAAQVSVVRNMLRAFLYSKPHLSDAMTDLNRVLTLNGLLAGFATLWVGCYDGATGELAYVNLGQEPALLRRAATGALEPLAYTGPILGISENATYEEKTVRLAAGDALVVFTDGMTECGPNRREMLGIDGVLELLAPPFAPEETIRAENLAGAILRRLRDGIETASRGGIAKDDVCILVAVAHYGEHALPA